MEIKIFNLFALLALLLAGNAQATQSVTFYHHDALGSVIAKSDADGYLYLNEEYQPYGEKIYAAEDFFGSSDDWYTGKNYSEELDLTYFGARWYDAKQGRFLSMDPAPVSLLSMHSFNRYHYANNNPYRYVDPNGEQAIDDDDVDGAGFDPLDSEEIDDATLSIGGGPGTRFVDGIKVHSIGAMGAGGGGGPKALTSSQVPNAGGKIVSKITTRDSVFFRVFSGDQTTGRFLTIREAEHRQVLFRHTAHNRS
ncbi:MAG TPA: RHS repeat-associated core domain-containing protein [Gammaproteobacteria bacterium]|nr:RHS repeat-associated core domain-containing protein [Gammaproteobacteria bacterium]